MTLATPARYAVFRIDHRQPPLWSYPFSVERVSGRDLTKTEAEAELKRRRREDRASRYELWHDRWIPWDSYTPETWAAEFPCLPPQRLVIQGIPSPEAFGPERPTGEALFEKVSGPTLVASTEKP